MLTRTLFQRSSAASSAAVAPMRLLSTTSLLRNSNKNVKPPLNTSRTSPMSDKDLPNHPGYTTYDTPATSDDPKDMPKAPGGSAPNSQTLNSSTQASPPHPQLEKMMTGGEREGSDAVGPEERTQKVWGPNARASEHNRLEGRRNPVLDGGSHEGGLREDGKGSKT